MDFHDNEYILADSLREGDKKAYEYVFDTYYTSLVDYAWRILHDEEAAEDIVQSLFMKIYEERETLTFSPPLKPYLFSSVYKRCLNELRHKKIVDAFVDKSIIDFYSRQVIQTPDEEINMRMKEVKKYLDEAVEALPTKCRDIYRLKYEQGLSNAEIAEMYAISPKTVEAQTTKALSRLRKDLAWLLFAITALNAGYDDIISRFAMQVPA